MFYSIKFNYCQALAFLGTILIFFNKLLLTKDATRSQQTSFKHPLYKLTSIVNHIFECFSILFYLDFCVLLQWLIIDLASVAAFAVVVVDTIVAVDVTVV